jgi:hypothetical protein
MKASFCRLELEKHHRMKKPWERTKNNSPRNSASGAASPSMTMATSNRFLRDSKRAIEERRAVALAFTTPEITETISAATGGGTTGRGAFSDSAHATQTSSNSTSHVGMFAIRGPEAVVDDSSVVSVDDDREQSSAILVETVTATAISDQDLEAEVRQRILNEAVHAAVVMEPSPATVEETRSLSKQNGSLMGRLRRRYCLWMLMAMLVAIIVTIVTTMVMTRKNASEPLQAAPFLPSTDPPCKHEKVFAPAVDT